MNNLEQFIRENKGQFDDQRPNRSLWLEIERNLDKSVENKKIFRLSFFKIAASVVLILSVGVLIGINYSASSKEMNYTISPEMKQYRDEAFYNTQVIRKLDQLTDPTIKRNVENDLKQLDEIYNELKSEMLNTQYANSSMMIDAMIQNHKTKVEILENILNKQNQIKNDTAIISM